MIIDKKDIDSVSRFSTLMSGVIAMPQLGPRVGTQSVSGRRRGEK
jgi:hypothetical protein